MPDLLASYVAGSWYTAPDEGAVVLDAATGDAVARVSTTDLDTRAMVDHARRVGGPALRRLTFQERARRGALHFTRPNSILNGRSPDGEDIGPHP